MLHDFCVELDVINEEGQEVFIEYRGQFSWQEVHGLELGDVEYEVNIDASSLDEREGDNLEWRKVNVLVDGYYRELEDAIDAKYREDFENESPF